MSFQVLQLHFHPNVITCPTVGRLAAASQRDFQRKGQRINLELQELSKVGDNRENADRKMKSIYGLESSKMPDPLPVTVPLWDVKNKQVIQEVIPMILACDMLHSLYYFYPEEFKTRILGGGPRKVTGAAPQLERQNGTVDWQHDQEV